MSTSASRQVVRAQTRALVQARENLKAAAEVTRFFPSIHAAEVSALMDQRGDGNGNGDANPLEDAGLAGAFRKVSALPDSGDEGGEHASPEGLIEAARNHLDAYDDPDDHMEADERLCRAARCLLSAIQARQSPEMHPSQGLHARFLR